MSFFDETKAAAVRGQDVRCAFLVFLDFVTQPTRVWSGFGSLQSGGETWEGLGTLGSIEGLEQATRGEAPVSSFRLSMGSDSVLASVRGEFDSEARNREVSVFIQFMNTDTSGQQPNDKPLDAPYKMWTGTMSKANLILGEDGTRSIVIEAESKFSRRSKPLFGLYTDRHQNRLFPGDKGFSFVPLLERKVVTWPDF